jgi:23S rRNA (cytosine1962-C5)-methyltransferase
MPYELLDFGSGRKLERFSGLILDRPSPAAEGIRAAVPRLWRDADFRFRTDGALGWSDGTATENWQFAWQELVLELKLSPFGHVGLFPEQISNWRWIQELVRGAQRPLRVLNLFGYTGGSTLAAAAASAEVVHVDASKPTVEWARRNAEHSGLTGAAIRWIIDDVRDFVEREQRRKAQYDLILLDPPAYGHGASGRDWRIERDLDPLMEKCLSLLPAEPHGLLLTGHSPIPSLKVGPIATKTWKALRAVFTKSSQHRVGLLDANRRKLDFGYAYRFTTNS